MIRITQPVPQGRIAFFRAVGNPKSEEAQFAIHDANRNNTNENNFKFF